MSLDIDQIAEAFCSHRFAVIDLYMAEEIKWNIVILGGKAWRDSHK